MARVLRVRHRQGVVRQYNVAGARPSLCLNHNAEVKDFFGIDHTVGGDSKLRVLIGAAMIQRKGFPNSRVSTTPNHVYANLCSCPKRLNVGLAECACRQVDPMDPIHWFSPPESRGCFSHGVASVTELLTHMPSHKVHHIQLKA